MLLPVASPSLQDLVYQQLSDALMGGSFWPGETLRINDLANRFGTSIMPVRDAVRRLATEGVLVVEPQKGVRVWQPTKKEFSEIAHLRAWLEPDVTAAAVPHLTKARIDKIEAIFNAMAKIESARDPRYLRMNKQAFFSIYEIAERPLSLHYIESLWRQIGPVLKVYVNSDAFPSTTELARNLIASLRSGDIPRVIECRRMQVLIPCEILLQHFDKMMAAMPDRPVDEEQVEPLPADALAQALTRPGRPRRI